MFEAAYVKGQELYSDDITDHRISSKAPLLMTGAGLSMCKISGEIS